MTVHCWMSRYEALGFTGMAEAIVALSDTWDGDGESLFDHVNDICLLGDGHDGEHEYTPTADISVTFAPAGAEDGAG